MYLKAKDEPEPTRSTAWAEVVVEKIKPITAVIVMSE